MWESDLPDLPSHFVLYGWTAIALHLGHRESVDFAFVVGLVASVADKDFDPTVDDDDLSNVQTGQNRALTSAFDIRFRWMIAAH